MDRLTDAGLDNAINTMLTIKECFGESEDVFDYTKLEFMKELKRYRDTGLTPEEIMDGKMLTGWIPVEERLPEEQENVLIQWELSRRHDNTVEIYLDKGRVCYSDRVYWLCDWGAPNGKVVAWMPLPETYNPEEGQP